MPAHPIDGAAHSIADLRTIAKRRLPKGIFEFVDRGLDDDVGIAVNRSAFDKVSIVPRMLVDISQRSLATTLFGKPVAAPIAVAPTGSAGLLWYKGEVALARAAAELGMPFTLSTASITPMEEVAEKAGGRLWFQLYLWPERAMSRQLVARAKAARYEALIVTVDTPLIPYRQYNYHNGYSTPFRPNRRNILDLALHPTWVLGVMGRYIADKGMPQFENFPDEMKARIKNAPIGSLAVPVADNLTWEELAELRKAWTGPLMVKGLLDPEDCERAVRLGIDGIIVSNHGGRNLDPAISTLQALPEIADRVAGRAAVMIDSGIRRGGDVVKALALGATCVFTGRAPLWGVAAAGEPGALRALSILRDEADRTLGFMGCTSIAGLARDYLRVEPGFHLERLPASTRPLLATAVPTRVA